MAGDAFVTLFRGLMESFKSLLTSPKFGTEYELLCSELSVQSLRVRLWGESVGINIDDSEVTQNSLIDRPDIKPTVVQTVDSISFLLTEIERLRHKYELRHLPARDEPGKDIGSPRCSKSGRSIINTVTTRQRMRANQKQKSLIAIAKWAISDGRKFEEKVKRLKGLIDGLEDISRAAGIENFSHASSQSLPSTEQDEGPPPYSLIVARARNSNASIPGPDIAAAAPSHRLSDNSICDILEHHLAMKRYLVTLQDCERYQITRGREKLKNLSEQQFKELRIDVYDELMRRQQHGMAPDHWLPQNLSFHPRRNEARRKLSTLITSRFGLLVSDVVFELERRFPQLQDHVRSSQPTFPDPFITHTDSRTRRWGCVRPHDANVSPPPLLQHRPAHRSTLKGREHVHVAHLSQPSPTIVELSTAQRASVLRPSLPGNPGSVEIFKSFRVSMEDPTSKVLPAALKKYNIKQPAEAYNLFVVYGDVERCLELDEKPLPLFKQLDKEGKKPMFMLRIKD